MTQNIEGQDIVYVGNSWFSENKTSSHHIAEILSKKNRILYIEGSGQRRPQPTKRDFLKILSKLHKSTTPPQVVESNLYLYSPLIIPFHGHALIRKINKIILSSQIRRACVALGFNNPLLWIILPHFSSIIGQLGEKGLVYYCVDEYSAQLGVDVDIIRKAEQHLLKNADVVFTVSEKLRENKSKENKNTYLSLHGVDTDLFRTALDNTIKLPKDIAEIKRPIAGFFGLLQPRVDLKLIRHIALQNVDISFVLIGMVAQDISGVSKLPNVYFLGAKPYLELPDYMRAFDVSLLPYRLDDEMINSNPKKLREYLAGGKPIVSVRIKEVERYQELIRISDSYNDFGHNVKLAIKHDNSPEKISARLKVVEQESWEARVGQVSKIVKEHISLAGAEG